jgi:hypothetical protein
MMREFGAYYWPELTRVAVPLGGWPERSLEYESAEMGVEGEVKWKAVA